LHLARIVTIIPQELQQQIGPSSSHDWSFSYFTVYLDTGLIPEDTQTQKFCVEVSSVEAGKKQNLQAP
jgi:hypothetical protein